MVARPVVARILLPPNDFLWPGPLLVWPSYGAWGGGPGGLSPAGWVHRPASQWLHTDDSLHTSGSTHRRGHVWCQGDVGACTEIPREFQPAGYLAGRFFPPTEPKKRGVVSAQQEGASIQVRPEVLGCLDNGQQFAPGHTVVFFSALFRVLLK